MIISISIVKQVVVIQLCKVPLTPFKRMNFAMHCPLLFSLSAFSEKVSLHFQVLKTTSSTFIKVFRAFHKLVKSIELPGSLIKSAVFILYSCQLSSTLWAVVVQKSASYHLSSGRNQKVIRQTSSIYEQLLSSCYAVVRQSSDSHQAHVQLPSIVQLMKLIVFSVSSFLSHSFS